MHLLLSFLITTILVSCGEPPAEEASGGVVSIGQLVVYEEEDFLSGTEKTVLSSACSALESKEEYFDRFIVNKGKKLQLSLKKTSCGGVFVSDKNFSSEVTESRSGLEFVGVIDGGFKDLVTDNSSIIKEYCSLVIASESVHRAERLRQSATWLRALKGGAQGCSDRKDQVCLIFSSGTKTNKKETYKITDIEILKIRLDDASELYGVVTQRTLGSNQLCLNKNQVNANEQSLLGL